MAENILFTWGPTWYINNEIAHTGQELNSTNDLLSLPHFCSNREVRITSPSKSPLI